MSPPQLSVADGEDALLGAGSRGEVRLGVYNGAHVAVKVYEGVLQASRKPLEHPGLVPVLERRVIDSRTLEIRGLCTQGELFDVVAEEGGLGEADALFWLRQIASAVAHCHSHGESHGQLRPEHVLLGGRTTQLLGFNGCVLQPDDPTGAASSPGADAPQLLRPVRAMDAPELHGRRGASHEERVRADAWGLGILMAFTFSAEPPFSSSAPNACAAYTRFRADGLRAVPSAMKAVPSSLHALLQAMLSAAPHSRPPASAVLATLTALGAPPRPVCSRGGADDGGADEAGHEARQPKKARADDTAATATERLTLDSPLAGSPARQPMLMASVGSGVGASAGVAGGGGACGGALAEGGHGAGHSGSAGEDAGSDRSVRGGGSGSGGGGGGSSGGAGHSPNTGQAMYPPPPLRRSPDEGYVRCLGWERLPYAVPRLARAIVESLDALGVRYKEDRTQYSFEVVVSPAKPPPSIEGASSSPASPQLLQVLVQIFQDELAKETNHVDVRRHGGERWQFHAFYNQFREQLSGRLGLTTYSELSAYSPVQQKREVEHAQPVAAFANRAGRADSQMRAAAPAAGASASVPTASRFRRSSASKEVPAADLASFLRGEGPRC